MNHLLSISDFNWLDQLQNEKILLPEARLALCDVILTHGGYLTGGFARRLTHFILVKRRIVDYADEESLLSVLYDSATLHGQPRTDDRLWKSFVDDIDVFFPNSVSAQDAVRSLLDKKTHRFDSPTLAGFGHEFVLGKNLMQLITRVTGTPEDVTGGFDIANAKVWLDSEGIHFSDEWLRLEKNRQLGIDITDKPNLLWRVQKWMNKHRYSDLREGDHAKYVDALLRAAEMTQDKRWIRWGKSVQLSEVQSKGKNFFSKLPPADLLKASLIYDSYDKLQVNRILAERVV